MARQDELTKMLEEGDYEGLLSRLREITSMLKDEDPERRKFAVQVLGELSEVDINRVKRYYSKILRLTEDPSEEVKAVAFRSLAKMAENWERAVERYPETIEILRKGLLDPSPKVRSSVVYAAERIGERDPERVCRWLLLRIEGEKEVGIKHLLLKAVRKLARKVSVAFLFNSVLPILETVVMRRDIISSEARRVLQELRSDLLRKVPAAGVCAEVDRIDYAVRSGDLEEGFRNLDKLIVALEHNVAAERALRVLKRLGEKAPGRLLDAVDSLVRMYKERKWFLGSLALDVLESVGKVYPETLLKYRSDFEHLLSQESDPLARAKLKRLLELIRSAKVP